MSSKRMFDIRPETFGRVAVKKLSTQSTSSPRANSRSHKCDPMKPAPPVTRMRRSLCILGDLLFSRLTRKQRHRCSQPDEERITRRTAYVTANRRNYVDIRSWDRHARGQP